MEEIGKILKELRIKKGLTIEEVQEITKIRSRYIQAIEEGNLDKLPGQFYAKAFIKSYAEVLELDPEIHAKYQESLPSLKIEHVEIKPHYQAMSSSPSKFGKLLISSLVYLLIGLVLLFAYMFYVSYYSDQGDQLPGDPLGENRLDMDNPDNQTDQNAGPDIEKPDTNLPEEDKEVFSIVKVSTTQYNNRNYDVYDVTYSSQEDVTVRLKFTERCWVDIRDGGPKGKQLISTTFNPGTETALFEFKETLWLHLGNARGVEIYINEELVKAGTENGSKFISINKIK